MNNSSQNSPKKIAVICCIERGNLEYKGLCMILSLRKNWGIYSNIPIYAYSPRRENLISEWLKEIYKIYNVTLIDEPINQKYLSYPLANKPLSMCHAEKNIDADFLVFLDSDILCWNEPTLFTLPKDKHLAMVVDGTKTVASYGPDDKKCEPMWQSLYKLAGVKRYEPFVTTLLTDEKVRGWWGSGVIVSRRSANLMQEWLALFENAVNSDFFIPQASYLREQMTICALAASHYDAFFELPVSYNYPVQNYYHYIPRGTNPDDAILWHYQPYMNKAFRYLRGKIDKADTIDKKIEIANNFIDNVKTKYPKMLGLDESAIKTWRKKLALGPRLRSFLRISKDGDPSYIKKSK